MNTDKELTPEENLMLIIKKHIPNGCVNLKSYGEEIGAITKCMIEYGRQQYEKGRQESKWIPLNIDLLEIEIISAAYKVTEEYLFTDGTNVGIGKIKIYHAHALRFNPGDWWPLVPALNGLPTHYMPKPSAPDQGKESKE